MMSRTARKFVVTTCLSIDMLLGAAAATEVSAIARSSDSKEVSAAPIGVAPLVGVAVVLSKDSTDPGEHAWSIRLSVPKVVWEIVGKQRPKVEWTKVKAEVELLTLDIAMGYSAATQLREEGQNRVVDLNGKRLSREEAHQRLASKTPVLVSVSGEMPDPFYLRCVKPDTLVVLFGLPSAREYNLLPTSRVDNRQAEPSAAPHAVPPHR